MTSTVEPVAPERPFTSSLWFHRLVALGMLLGLIGSGYLLKFAHCEADSKFCALHVAGTRSDVVCEWDSWSCFVTTDGDEPSTHVFLHLGG